MDHRKLGPSGTVVSHLALGTMTFGDEASEEASFAMMDAYAAAGGTAEAPSTAPPGAGAPRVSARRSCSRPRSASGSYSRWPRRRRATTAPEAATPATPARPMSFQGTRTQPRLDRRDRPVGSTI